MLAPELGCVTTGEHNEDHISFKNYTYTFTLLIVFELRMYHPGTYLYMQLCFSRGMFFEMLTVTVTVYNFRGGMVIGAHPRVEIEKERVTPVRNAFESPPRHVWITLAGTTKIMFELLIVSLHLLGPWGSHRGESPPNFRVCECASKSVANPTSSGKFGG